MFCAKCGAEVKSNSSFCGICGSKISQGNMSEQKTKKIVNGRLSAPLAQHTGSSSVRTINSSTGAAKSLPPGRSVTNNAPVVVPTNIKGTVPATSSQLNPLIGFSSRLKFDDKFALALKPYKKKYGLISGLLIPTPIAVMSLAATSAGVSPGRAGLMAFLLTSFFTVSHVISVSKHDLFKFWNGSVFAKTVEKRYDKYGIEFNAYVLKIRTDRGKVQEIIEKEDALKYYDYFEIGDRVRHYPFLNNYYEIYDKTKVKYVFCPVCGTRNDISKELCENCGLSLIK